MRLDARVPGLRRGLDAVFQSEWRGACRAPTESVDSERAGARKSTRAILVAAQRIDVDHAMLDQLRKGIVHAPQTVAQDGLVEGIGQHFDNRREQKLEPGSRKPIINAGRVIGA